MGSPPCRHLCVREAHENPQAVDNNTSLNLKSLSQIERDFFWLFEVLWNGGDKLYQLRFPNVLDELQRMMDCEPKIKDFITPLVASEISDLAIIAECLRQVDTYQPWANMFEDQVVDQEDRIEEDQVRFRRPTGKVVHAIKGSDSVLARFGTPEGDKFYYPVGKRKSKENTEALRHAELNLDAF